MNRIVKASSITLLVLAVGAGTYVIGYDQGFRDRNSSLGDAAGTATVLKSLREGHQAQAVELLELQLDSYIVAFAVNRDRFSPYRFVFGDLNAPIMRGIAEYRTSVPSQAPDPQVRALIVQTVARESNVR